MQWHHKGRTYLVDLLRLDLHQTFHNVALVILHRTGLEGIRAHFIPSESALVDDHGYCSLQCEQCSVRAVLDGRRFIHIRGHGVLGFEPLEGT
jgi:hypothetical protein